MLTITIKSELIPYLGETCVNVSCVIIAIVPVFWAFISPEEGEGLMKNCLGFILFGEGRC